MKRRPNGTGSIFKRKNGRWEAQVFVTQVNGEFKRVCVSAKTYAAVKAKLDRIQEKEKLGLAYSEKDWTVAEYLDYWLNEIHYKKVRETTLDAYSRTIKNHIKPVLGSHKLKLLTVQNMRQALDALEARGCSGRIRLDAVKIMSICLKCAMTEELIMRNVAQLVEKPQHIAKETVVWTAAQAAQFLRSIKGHKHYIAFLLFLIYGMRRGEVLGLRYCDIDFENGLIYVRQQIGRIGGTLKARLPKTKKSSRVLQLRSHVRIALLEHAEKNGITIPPFKPLFELSTKGTVVVSDKGTPLEPRSLARCFSIMIKQTGLPRTTLHAMRHMEATFLKDIGTPLKDVQVMLGHSDSMMTLGYQHGNPEIHQSSVSAIENLLLG